MNIETCFPFLSSGVKVLLKLQINVALQVSLRDRTLGQGVFMHSTMCVHDLEHSSKHDPILPSITVNMHCSEGSPSNCSQIYKCFHNKFSMSHGVTVGSNQQRSWNSSPVPVWHQWVQLWWLSLKHLKQRQRSWCDLWFLGRLR